SSKLHHTTPPLSPFDSYPPVSRETRESSVIEVALFLPLCEAKPLMIRDPLIEGATQLFINGEPRDGSSAKRIPQINPATEEVFTEVAAAALKDVEAAVEGAQRAFAQTWRDLSPRKRTDILFNIARLIRENTEPLAQLESRNIGKPITDARDEVQLGARVFEYYAGAVTKLF